MTVGQDLVRLELGGAPEGGEKEKAPSEPKEAASNDQSTSSDPEPSKPQDSEPKDESSPPPPQPQEKKSEPKKDTPAPKPADKGDSKPSTSGPTLGSREERRVWSAFVNKS